jgi:hypothetical protein
VELHHVDATPAPEKHFEAAPVTPAYGPAPTLLNIKPTFVKTSKS